MVTTPFAEPPDVETALLRPLTDAERPYVPDLIDKASGLLRTRVPSIDDRIELWNQDPKNLAGVSPSTVATVVAGVVKRYMTNPQGFVSETQTVAEYSTSHSYALRGEKETRGEMRISDEDLAVLFPNRKRARVGSFRLSPALAPRPVGRYGPVPTPVEAYAAEVTFGSGSNRHPVAGEQDFGGSVL